MSVRRAARIDGDLVAGALRLHQPIAGDAVTRSLLGQEGMRGPLVTLDRARGLAQFVTPAGDAPAPLPAPPALRGTGIASAPGRDHLEVLLVVPGSGGEAAGIRAGDRIIAVDGVPVGSEGCTGRREERESGAICPWSAKGRLPWCGSR